MGSKEDMLCIMNTELGFSSLQQKDNNIGLNDLDLQSPPRSKYLLQDEVQNQVNKRNNGNVFYSEEVDIPIYESVQAVLKKDVYQHLRMEINSKLLHNLRNYAEPFEISELENGQATFTGTLKAILHCQQLLCSFIKTSNLFGNQKKRDDSFGGKKIFCPLSSTHGREIRNSERFEKEGMVCELNFLEENLLESQSNKNIITNKVLSMGTIPRKNKSELGIKPELGLETFGNNKNSIKYQKLNVAKENNNDNDAEFPLVYQKLSLDSVCDSENTNFCSEDPVSLCETNFTSLTNALSRVNESASSLRNTKNSKFSCDICSFKCIKESQLVRHLNYHEKTCHLQLSHHSQIQKEQLCPPKYSSKVLRKPKMMKYECEICNGVFESPSIYQQHIYDHELLEEKQTILKMSKIPVTKKFTCEVCGFKARLQREYKLHLENAHPITYSCPQCSYGTMKKVHYIRHVRNVHENQRPYRCQLCGVAFKRRDALKQHQVVHFKDSKSLVDCHTKVPFKCKVCKKVVRSAAYLREHMLTHSDERSFLCEVCGASFKTRAVHRNHLKVVHSRDLRAICRYCGKTFATKYSLKRHMRQHETSRTPCKEKKLNEKFRFMKNQESSNEWNPLLLSPDIVTTESSVPTVVEDKEEIVSLSKSSCIVTTISNTCNDKIIPSVYTESTASGNFGISIDNQIPYVIHATQEVTSD